jgi:lipopolysaccharide/colanic/teichoic acid biosynthesis glycosyltransferase
MISLKSTTLSGYQRVVKRILDLVFSMIFLIPALPLSLFLSMVIKLDTPGPTIIRQWRVGENGRLFRMYKFRSMINNAEAALEDVVRTDPKGNTLYKFANDPRITRVGRWIRRTSLDEIPQLINVLKGEMSLVGPRPELPRFVALYQPWQQKRFAVPQGITGWWQVNGRSELPMHLNTEYDIYYVQNYSVILDIQILIRTFWVVIRGVGAF